ncbi:hypothetical protein SSS_06260 [Sarcoptes scabiei]|nr:hypothetical protein SSS_06260 [Sarcoptes scabiei]
MASITQSTIPNNFFGKYKLFTSENFDNFLKEIGIGLLKRKLANSTYPTVEFLQDANNDELIYKSHTIIKTSETKFKLGQEFDEDRLDGKRVKSLNSLTGINSFKHKGMEIWRSNISENSMVMKSK